MSARTQAMSVVPEDKYRSLNSESVLVRFWWCIIPSYLCCGAVFYHLSEGWGWIDSVYFCCVCLTTVGYGDLFPTKTMSKIFTTLFLLFGLSLVATSLGGVIASFEGRLERRRAGGSS